jgi:hypothetical protein
MFNCRVCSNTPFGSLFGYEDDDADEDAHRRRSTRELARDIRSKLTKEGSEGENPGSRQLI